MKDWIVTIATTEGESTIDFRCDYDVAEAVRVLEYVTGLIGIKPSRGGMKWYRGIIDAGSIVIAREADEYAGGSN